MVRVFRYKISLIQQEALLKHLTIFGHFCMDFNEIKTNKTFHIVSEILAKLSLVDKYIILIILKMALSCYPKVSLKIPEYRH